MPLYPVGRLSRAPPKASTGGSWALRQAMGAERSTVGEVSSARVVSLERTNTLGPNFDVGPAETKRVSTRCRGAEEGWDEQQATKTKDHNKNSREHFEAEVPCTDATQVYPRGAWVVDVYVLEAIVIASIGGAASVLAAYIAAKVAAKVTSRSKRDD